LSPQSRRGKAAQPARKPRPQAAAAPKAAAPAPAPTPAKAASVPAPKTTSAAPPKSSSKPAPAPEKAAETAAAEEQATAHARSEARRARMTPGRKKAQHGTAYRWIAAYFPLMGGLFVLLAALWVWTSIINPPPPTPAQQWTKIESKWEAPREQARVQVAAAAKAQPFDLAKYQAATAEFDKQTTGWMNDLKAVKDWGVGANDVTTLQSAGAQLTPLFTQVAKADTIYKLSDVNTTISQWDATFSATVVLIDLDFGLSPTASGHSPIPTASPLAFPSIAATPTPVPTATPVPSASVAPSVTPAPSASPVPSASPS
jgi:hypothetical protein